MTRVIGRVTELSVVFLSSVRVARENQTRVIYLPYLVNIWRRSFVVWSTKWRVMSHVSGIPVSEYDIRSLVLINNCWQYSNCLYVVVQICMLLLGCFKRSFTVATNKENLLDFFYFDFLLDLAPHFLNMQTLRSATHCLFRKGGHIFQLFIFSFFRFFFLFCSFSLSYLSFFLSFCYLPINQYLPISEYG